MTQDDYDAPLLYPQVDGNGGLEDVGNFGSSADLKKKKPEELADEIVKLDNTYKLVYEKKLKSKSSMISLGMRLLDTSKRWKMSETITKRNCRRRSKGKKRCAAPLMPRADS